MRESRARGESESYDAEEENGSSKKEKDKKKWRTQLESRVRLPKYFVLAPTMGQRARILLRRYEWVAVQCGATSKDDNNS